MNWRLSGACRRYDPEMWFPSQGDVATREAALAICRQCQVLKVCAKYSLHHRIPYGIWGGMSQKKRSRILRTPADRARVVNQ